jgi:rhodanese-related sulfurtransferase
MSLFSIFKKPQTKTNLQMSAVEFVHDRDAGGIVIDVRTPAEYQSARLKDAQNIDISSPDFSKRVSALEGTEVYYLYCRSGARSQKAAEIMSRAGFRAFNIGGLQALESAGADIKRG